MQGTDIKRKARDILLNLRLLMSLVGLLLSFGCATTTESERSDKDPSMYLNQASYYAKIGQYDRALSYFEKALEINPNLAKAYNDRGIIYARQGRYEKAISDFSRSIKINPSLAKPYRNRANAYLRQGGYQEAISDFSKILELNPKDAKAYSERGNVYAIQRAYDNALSDYNKAIEIDPLLEKTYYNRGNVFGKRGQYDKALSDFTKAIEINPRYDKAYLSRGVTWGKKGHHDKTIADCTRALEVNPSLAVAYPIRGVAWRKKGNIRQALADFKEALKLMPDDERIKRNIARLEAEIQRKQPIRRPSPPIGLKQGTVQIQESECAKIVSDAKASVAKAYVNRGLLSFKRKDFDQAIGDFTRAIRANPRYAEAYHCRGLVYGSKGDLDGAISDFDKAISLSPEFAIAYNSRGLAYSKKGDLDQAIHDYSKALKLKPQYADPYKNRGLAWKDKGDLERALADLKTALELMPNDIKLAKTIADMEAEIRSQRVSASSSQETQLGEAELLALELSNLESQGLYIEAIPVAEKLLAIMEGIHGTESQEIVDLLYTLANCYVGLQEYEKAEPLLKRGLAIRSKQFAVFSPEMAESHYNMGILYLHLGKYEAAEAYFKLAIVEIATNPYQIHCLLSLAILYIETKQYDKTKPVLEKMSSMAESYRQEHPAKAFIFTGMAQIYSALGEYSKAESLLEASVRILEEVLGQDHLYLAPALNKLGSVYLQLGDNERAEPLLERALSISEMRFGPEHPYVSLSLNSLASLYTATGQIEKAYDFFRRALAADNNLVNLLMGISSDEALILLLVRRWFTNHFLFLTLTHKKQESSDIRYAFNAWLKRKGEILEAQRDFQEALLYGGDSQTIGTFRELSRVRSQLAHLAFASPSVRERVSYRMNISKLEAKRTKLEAKLTNLSPALALNREIAQANCERVASRMPINSALIDFARVGIFKLGAKSKERELAPARYMAFLLQAGHGDQVQMIDLGNARDIDKAVALFRQSLSSKGGMSIREVSRLCRQLYDILFEPLRKKLGDTKEIFVAPDGSLNLIPFEVLQSPNGRYLIEDYVFTYLASGRDILGFGQSKDSGKKVLILGDPDYDLGAEEKGVILKKLALEEGSADAGLNRSTKMRELYFTRVPGAREEVNEIQALIREKGVEIYTGKKALEEVLRKNGPPKILHLATHTFFLEDLLLSDLVPGDLGGGAFQSGMFPSQKMAGANISMKSPLLRSGIALAGANYTLTSKDAEKCLGIVTVEKILGLKLLGTDLVVLSCCDTGLGEVEVGDGISGLRRAFTQAGAKSVGMSMWLMPERERKELILEFYKNLLSGKTTRSQALRKATLKEIQTVEERYGHTNPLFWGAFVFVGEP